MQSFIRARKAAGPLLPLHVGDGDDGYSKAGVKRSRWLASTPARICLATLALTVAAMVWWLSAPIVKAYRTARTPDHPSEAAFVDHRGCVGRGAAASAVALVRAGGGVGAGALATHWHHFKRSPLPMRRCRAAAAAAASP